MAYEASKNPDAGAEYGFLDLEPSCAATVPPAVADPQPYPGVVESHPYAVASTLLGFTFVADAAANDILVVTPWGTVRTVAVLPPVRIAITADIATRTGLPPCTVGATYVAEPVPTDVEIGPTGWLYVTTLPGKTALSGVPLGSVYAVNPLTGRMKLLATGFSSPVNLAVTPRGRVYVAELFANRISTISDGEPSPVVTLPQPAALEYAHGKLYASVNALSRTGAAALVTVEP
jgi:DNA-binding beta-propeller fold protein YncE